MSGLTSSLEFMDETVAFAEELATREPLEGPYLFIAIMIVLALFAQRAQPILMKFLDMMSETARWAVGRFDRSPVPAMPAGGQAPVRADFDTKLAQKNKMIEALSDDVTRLGKEKTSLLETIEDLNAQIVQLNEGRELSAARAKVIERELLRDLITNWPGSKILFVKEFFADDDEFRMIGVSPGYADTFLDQPASVYHGKTDAEVWGAEVARNYQRGDRIAIQNLQMVPVNEVVSNALNGVEGTYTGWKKGMMTPSGLLIILSVGELHTPSVSGSGLSD